MATLISRWTFDNTYNDAVGSNNLSAGGSGNTFSSSTRVVGNYSLVLNGSGNARNTGTFSGINTGNTDASFGGWFNLNDFNARRMLLAFGGVSDNNQWSFYINSASSISLEIRGHDVKTWTPTFTTGNWYWAWIQYTASTKVEELFFNNVSQGTFTITDTPNITAGPIYIGSDDGLGAACNGYLDDFRIYNGVTTSTDRLSIYNAGNQAGGAFLYNFM